MSKIQSAMKPFVDAVVEARAALLAAGSEPSPELFDEYFAACAAETKEFARLMETPDEYFTTVKA